MQEEFEPTPGGLLEVVDMLCSVTSAMADVVRKQAVLIEQGKIADAVFPDLEEQRKKIDDDLDIIEARLRRI